jgi:hypothetical protein
MAPAKSAATTGGAAALASTSGGIDRGRFDLPTALAWAVVVLPIAWAVWMTLTKVVVLFH